MSEVTSQHIQTTRLNIHYLASGNNQGIPVLLIHGNASSSTFWKQAMQTLPTQYYAIAPDLRGYGDTEDKVIDATRGLNDFVDDLSALVEALKIDKFHVIGHSLGGAVVLNLLNAQAANILSTTLVNPGSPYGFGGTKDPEGTPCFEDFSGSGGGIVNPAFAQRMASQDRTDEDPTSAPVVVMNSFYWKPPFKAENETELLTSLLSQKTGENRYPGDFASSSNYPFVAPGKYGPMNALSPKYVGDSVEKLWQLPQKPSVLWVRGADDQIVSDNSLFDLGTHGLLGNIPNYPGKEVFPPQPMVSQTRYVLEKYQEKGGKYTETVIENCGHTPHVEKATEFDHLWHQFLAEN